MKEILFKKNNKVATVLLYFILIIILFPFLSMFTGFNQLLMAPLVRNEKPTQADTIIVLGGGVVKHLKVLPWGASYRIKKGSQLYQEKLADKILVTGGQVKGQPYTESQFMKDYLIFLGVPKDDIIKESKSTSTFENAIFSKEVLGLAVEEKVILVTSDYHTRRACNVFTKAGYTIDCVAATPTVGMQDNPFRKLNEFSSVLREYAATVYYLINGYI